jgi:DNA-binding ferritin-like protein
MSRSSKSMSRSMGKSMGNLQNFEQHIVIKFLEILNVVKLYHWKTFSYATHKATDEFHQKIEDNIDTFVETLLGKGTGKYGDRINLSKVKSISLKEFNSLKDFKREITDFSKYLTALNSTPLFKDPTSSDLLTIRDEILKDVNQFLYLLTFS